jgi:hypothetical protein
MFLMIKSTVSLLLLAVVVVSLDFNCFGRVDGLSLKSLIQNQTSSSAHHKNHVHQSKTGHQKHELHHAASASKVLASRSTQQPSNGSARLACRELEVDELEVKLGEYYAVFMSMGKEMLKLLERNLTKPVEIRAELMDHSQCSARDRVMRNTSQLSICPWVSTTVHRPNMFPESYTESKCTCDKCLQLNGHLAHKTYRCEPLTRPVPFLYRTGECLPTGLFEWKGRLEEVSVSCGCVMRPDMIPS